MSINIDIFPAYFFLYLSLVKQDHFFAQQNPPSLVTFQRKSL